MAWQSRDNSNQMDVSARLAVQLNNLSKIRHELHPCSAWKGQLDGYE
jgi:hypothetical protein